VVVALVDMREVGCKQEYHGDRPFGRKIFLEKKVVFIGQNPMRLLENAIFLVGVFGERRRTQSRISTTEGGLCCSLSVRWLW
jgi:hypothetical protein